LNHAGLKSLKSLEVLDVSHNQMARVGSGSLEGMEWLVELKVNIYEILVILKYGLLKNIGVNIFSCELV
jgi:Ran GTPase-activating protein (RanGAP) involved in mRNA processing and transport